MKFLNSRNPYFSGFSLAINMVVIIILFGEEVAILILVDFPLQLKTFNGIYTIEESRNPYFSGFSLAIQ